MLASLLLFGDCPVCGYRNKGIRVGTARPGMRRLTMQPGSLIYAPGMCGECGHPMAHELYDRIVADEETTAKLKAWQDRQRQRQRQRRASQKESLA